MMCACVRREYACVCVFPAECHDGMSGGGGWGTELVSGVHL